MVQSLLTSLATLFGSPLLSDCQVVFYNAENVSNSRDACGAAESGPEVLQTLPAHLLALWSGSALFRAQAERWPVQKAVHVEPVPAGGGTEAATSAAAETSGPAPATQPQPQPPPQPKAQLRAVLDTPSDLPYALAALRYLYTFGLGHVTGGAAELLHVRRLAGYLQIPECVAACEEALVALVAPPALPATGNKSMAGAAASAATVVGPIAGPRAAAAAAGAGAGARAAGAAARPSGSGPGAAAAAAGAVCGLLPPAAALPSAVVDVYLAARALLKQPGDEDEGEEGEEEELLVEEPSDADSEPDMSDKEEGQEEGQEEDWEEQGLILVPAVAGWVGYGGNPGDAEGGSAGLAASAALLARLRLACLNQLVSWAAANEQALQVSNAAEGQRWLAEQVALRRARREERTRAEWAEEGQVAKAGEEEPPAAEEEQVPLLDARGEGTAGGVGAAAAAEVAAAAHTSRSNGSEALNAGAAAAVAQPPQQPQQPQQPKQPQPLQAPQPPQPHPSFGALLAWAVRSAPHALSDDGVWQELASLNAAGLEALLAAESFATDDEASVLLLLAKWVAVAPGRKTDKEALQRLFMLVRLCHMNDVYRTIVVLPLAADWLPGLDLAPVRAPLKQWSGANAMRRFRLRQVALFSPVARRSRWFVSQPRPAAPLLDLAWSIPGEVLDSSWEPADGSFGADNAEALYANGFRWTVTVQSGNLPDRGGVFLNAAVPSAVWAGGSRGEEADGALVSLGQAVLLVYGRARNADGAAASKATYQVPFGPNRDLVELSGWGWGYTAIIPLAPQSQQSQQQNTQATPQPAQTSSQQSVQAAAQQDAQLEPPRVEKPWALHLHDDGYMHGRLRVRCVQRRL